MQNQSFKKDSLVNWLAGGKERNLPNIIFFSLNPFRQNHSLQNLDATLKCGGAKNVPKNAAHPFDNETSKLNSPVDK